MFMSRLVSKEAGKNLANNIGKRGKSDYQELYTMYQGALLASIGAVGILSVGAIYGAYKGITAEPTDNIIKLTRVPNDNALKRTFNGTVGATGGALASYGLLFVSVLLAEEVINSPITPKVFSFAQEAIKSSGKVGGVLKSASPFVASIAIASGGYNYYANSKKSQLEQTQVQKLEQGRKAEITTNNERS
jgi:hypothetical protein